MWHKQLAPGGETSYTRAQTPPRGLQACVAPTPYGLSLWLVRDRGLTNCVCVKPRQRNQLSASAGIAPAFRFHGNPVPSRPLPCCLTVVPSGILAHLNVSLKQA